MIMSRLTPCPSLSCGGGQVVAGLNKLIPTSLEKMQVSNNNYINYINKFTQVTTNTTIDQERVST